MINTIKLHFSNCFKNYASAYDIADPKIKLKVAHTYRVAALCETIAGSIGSDAGDTDPKLSEDDILFAWLSGMLHDMGRFEQVKRYNTFIDAQSVDHAQFGADLLFKEGLYKQFADALFQEEKGLSISPLFTEKMANSPDETGSHRAKEAAAASSTEDERTQSKHYHTLLTKTWPGLLEKVIRAHNMFRIPTNLTSNEAVFANILRDADKVDIFRVNYETPLEDIYNVTTKELKEGAVSEGVKQAYLERHCALRSAKSSAVDNLVGHVCLFFELVYPQSRLEALSQGYINKLLAFESDNVQTGEWFLFMRKDFEAYTASTTAS